MIKNYKCLSLKKVLKGLAGAFVAVAMLSGCAQGNQNPVVDEDVQPTPPVVQGTELLLPSMEEAEARLLEIYGDASKIYLPLNGIVRRAYEKGKPIKSEPMFHSKLHTKTADGRSD